MNIAIAFIAFLVVALILWGIGELNYKGFHYEEDIPHHPDPTAHQGGEYVELSLRDILRDNSTKGYIAVG
ncbi:MAG: hypothetical protein ACOYJK_05470 [Prevotella sp.]|jgi:hypothetical protein